MAWDIFLINNANKIFSLAMLLGAVFFSCRLMFNDKKSSWNFVTLAIAFLAISIAFDILDETLKISIFNVLKHLSMMFSGLMFVTVLSIARKQKDGLR